MPVGRVRQHARYAGLTRPCFALRRVSPQLAWLPGERRRKTQYISQRGPYNMRGMTRREFVAPTVGGSIRLTCVGAGQSGSARLSGLALPDHNRRRGRRGDRRGQQPVRPGRLARRRALLAKSIPGARAGFLDLCRTPPDDDCGQRAEGVRWRWRRGARRRSRRRTKSASDTDRHLFIVERDAHVVRRTTRSIGVVSTFAGTNASQASAATAGRPAARSSGKPHSIAFSTRPAILVPDIQNARIRAVKPWEDRRDQYFFMPAQAKARAGA